MPRPAPLVMLAAVLFALAAAGCGSGPASGQPSAIDPPSGCPFHTRCPLEEQSRPQSEQETPGLIDVGDGHMVACHLAGPGREVPRVA